MILFNLDNHIQKLNIDMSLKSYLYYYDEYHYNRCCSTREYYLGEFRYLPYIKNMEKKEIEEFVKFTKGVSELGIWIFTQCDICSEHAGEPDKLWLHASLVKKSDVEGLI